MTGQRRSAMLAAGAAIASGALHYWASPALGWWPLSFVALVPLVLACRNRAPLTAAKLGACCGAVTIGLGFAWLPGVLLDFTENAVLTSTLASLVFWGWHAARWAVLCALARSLVSARWSESISFLVAHALVELIFPTLFPWYLASAVHAVPILIQTADLGGPILVSSVLVAGNLAVVSWVDGWQSAGKTWDRFGGLVSRRGAACAGVVVIAVGYGMVRIGDVDENLSDAATLRIGLVQPDEPRAERDRDAAVERQLHLTRQLEGEADLVVWGEAAVPGVLRQDEVRDRLKRLLVPGVGAPLLFGAKVAEGVGTEQRHYNVAYLAAQGKICRTCRYDKQLLLPLGEYVPLAKQLTVLTELFPNSSQLTSGVRSEPLRMGEHRIDVSICYEDLHATRFNRKTIAPRHLLVNLTNDVWFAGTPAPHWHFILAKFRAIEQRRYLVRVTNSGMSGVVDPAGRVETQLMEGERDAAVSTVRWLSGDTVFHHLGHLPWWALALTCSARLLLGRQRHPPRTPQAARPRPAHPATSTAGVGRGS